MGISKITFYPQALTRQYGAPLTEKKKKPDNNRGFKTYSIVILGHTIITTSDGRPGVRHFKMTHFYYNSWFYLQLPVS